MRFRIATVVIGLVGLGGAWSPSAEAQEFHKSITLPAPPPSADDLTAAGGAEGISDIIYVNRCTGGCSITAGGFNDARDNVSTIPSRNSTLSEFAHSEQVFNDTIQCLREVYGPYDVEIVTEDPGNVFHHEAILAGTPTELGQDPSILGIANGGCAPRNNAISFSFANAAPPNVIDLCWTVAQESAHAFGLDHAFACRDPMTYLPGCGQKFFRNELLPCGEFDPRACQCSGAFQNSHVLLTAVHGVGTLPDPPALEILLPADGATVSGGDAVYVSAIDPRLVHTVDLYINGWMYDSIEGHEFNRAEDPYQFTIPSELPDSIMDIEIVASNDLDVSSSAQITVTKGAPCTSVDTCLDGQECNEGRCEYPAPTAVLGESCERDMDCTTFQCAFDSAIGGTACTQSCLTTSLTACPDGFECVPFQAGAGDGLCLTALETEDTGGCCSVGQSRGLDGGQIALYLLVAGVLVMGRRRRDKR